MTGLLILPNIPIYIKRLSNFRNFKTIHTNIAYIKKILIRLHWRKGLPMRI